MNKDMLGKTLTLGVIILFITVGIQPALAVEPKLSSDNKTETVEDCDCQTAVSEVDLNRLDKYTEFKDLSNRVSTLSKIDEDNSTICDLLILNILINLGIIKLIDTIIEFGNINEYDDPLLFRFLENRQKQRYNLVERYRDLFIYFYDCWGG
jgi:hypothetical protein